MSEYFYVKIGGYNRKEQIQQQIQELKPCLKDWETRKRESSSRTDRPDELGALSKELPQVLLELKAEAANIDLAGGHGRQVFNAVVSTIWEAHFPHIHLSDQHRTEYQGALGFNHVTGLINRIMLVTRKFIMGNDNDLGLDSTLKSTGFAHLYMEAKFRALTPKFMSALGRKGHAPDVDLIYRSMWRLRRDDRSVPFSQNVLRCALAEVEGIEIGNQWRPQGAQCAYVHPGLIFRLAEAQNFE
ncbi:hypothetical protein A1Q1_01567 [Trichosporon asahii var. asahii CBS 2479]|uniref:Uncharacterized protein n=1 Tax=Trichosporon asahii var. asahii (strain ATCC 90039 / CBS 2479 / JCM 2466 / KCTC 7840 / NBRC 103889/ NCYC 2677 / UAMH 7654) TaxID=1186058 RepID=J4UDV3_TRIAS|nr:hypothetical protein A1Q1_01567 [Trichosporon asahii var. asahii CBS 2479]EJT49365.1 hypothetical protein A1Q1_01567 [Trichosporon asahii var. asahii CBS 2479]